MTHRSITNVAARSCGVALALLGALALAGCTQEAAPAPTAATVAPPVPVSSGSATASATAAAPATFTPDGDANANLPAFLAAVDRVWATDARGEGRAYIDELVATGFTDTSAMQLTPDVTTIGNPAESIQFSVLWHGECLIGQVGDATGEPVAAVEPAISEGVCLVGTTRPIDW